jgi:hypothetical protein
MALQIFQRVLVSLIVLRAAYAVALLVILSLFRLGWANLLNIDGYFAEVMNGLTAGQTVIWVSYVSGYAIAAILALRASQLSAWFYGGAMTLDLGVWIYTALSPSYNLIGGGQASTIDIIFNIFDLGALLCLIILVRQRVFR